jgi:two-component system chemotaxis sensor kinase CheA
MDDLIKDFLVESYENLDRLDRDFVDLEKNPSTETLGSIFRAIHTIKGTCGFLGFSKLEAVSHAGENLLSLLRDGQLQVNQPITDALLAMVDVIRQMLAGIEANGAEGERDDSALIDMLGRLQRGETAAAKPSVQIPQVPEKKKRRRKKLSSHSGEVAAKLPDQISSATPCQADEEPALPVRETADAAPGQAESKTSVVSDSTVRVDVGLLDKLMNLVGELVLSRNQIMQFAVSHEDATFTATSQHLNLVTGELQEGVMKTRMLPIGNVWYKFPRVVRDLAALCGKQVRIEMEGAETELDRTIIEAIKDPLTHAVRNSVDHGVETPEQRIAAGKPPEGCIRLRAFHEGGQVNIEISDDGGGIDPEKIRDKALKKGHITPEQAARMSERELVNLIFAAGLSTADKVTNVSGRGVGMDVVKTNIEKIGGTVDVQSKLDQGTTLKVKIPLTLAIIPALMVTTGGDQYAIPQVSLLELVRVRGREAGQAIEMVHGAPVYRLRGNLLPLIYLHRELHVESKTQSAAVNIVVLQADGQQFGLVVDSINDSKDIVVKPLGKHLKGISVFSGATILGDGKVALILDVIGISQSANVVSEARARSLGNITPAPQQTDAGRQTLLICRHNKEDRIGIPLSLVARLEQFPLSTVERSSAHEVVQYRGEIMPLVRLSQVLGSGGYDEAVKDTIEVVVYSQQGKSVGLVVDQITDIVEERVTVKADRQGSYLLGAAVVQGKVTDILDVRGVIEAVDPSYLGQPEAA